MSIACQPICCILTDFGKSAWEGILIVAVSAVGGVIETGEQQVECARSHQVRLFACDGGTMHEKLLFYYSFF